MRPALRVHDAFKPTPDCPIHDPLHCIPIQPQQSQTGSDCAGQISPEQTARKAKWNRDPGSAMTRKSFSPVLLTTTAWHSRTYQCLKLHRVQMPPRAAPADGRQTCIPCRIPDTTLRALDHIPTDLTSYPPCPIHTFTSHGLFTPRSSP